MDHRRRTRTALTVGLLASGGWMVGALGALPAGAAASGAAASGATERPASASAGTTSTANLELSRLLSLARNGNVRTARLDDATDTVTGTAVVAGRVERYQTAYPSGFGAHLTATLLADHVQLSVTPSAAAAAAGGIAGGSATTFLILAIAFTVLASVGIGAWRRRAPGDGKGSGTRLHTANSPASFADGHGEQVEVPPTRFGDVAGLDEAVDTMAELVDALRDPERYRAAGAELPHGYLLVGPPGTGKTLLARAVAGEAGVPFFAIGASEFVESYVGVGAARVRTLFDRARAAERAIVFIDELDAVGRSRSTHAVPGNEERENTLNQLLVEMDGFKASSVVVLAATNRPDVLDTALLRPGRFDHQVAVPLPDRAGRARILRLYLARRPVTPAADVEALARRTAGLSGADLANLANAAAFVAVRARAGKITDAHLDEALATVALGPARKSAVVTEHDRRVTAWHEAGHALTGLWLEHAADPISVSIVPRGQAGGVTWFPGHDDVFLTRRQAEAQLVVAMGGRVAEELLLGDDFTQGAMQDFKAATDLARHMVTEYGMSRLGPGYVPPEETHLGVLAERVHQATDELLEHALRQARELLVPARAVLERVVARLLEDETLDTATLSAVAGRSSGSPSGRPGPAARTPVPALPVGG